MIQRVAAAEGASSGVVRRMRPSVSPAAAASESRRVATWSMSRARNLADRHADGAAAQRLLHRPQHIAAARGGDRDQPFGSDAGLVETGSIGHAVLGEREILGDPEHASSPLDRVIQSSRWRPGMQCPVSPAQRQCQREAGGGGESRSRARPRSRAARRGKPAAERAVDRGDAERNRAAHSPARPVTPPAAQSFRRSRSMGVAGLSRSSKSGAAEAMVAS